MAVSNCWQHILAYGQGLSEEQQKRIRNAVDKLKSGVSAHARGREVLGPERDWVNISQRGFGAEAARALSWNEQIQTLGREITECVGVVVEVRAEAFWYLGAVEPFRKRVETDALDILRRVLACVDSRDLQSLDQASLRAGADSVVSKWVLKAQLEFPPILPSPVDDGSMETGSPDIGTPESSTQGAQSAMDARLVAVIRNAGTPTETRRTVPMGAAVKEEGLSGAPTNSSAGMADATPKRIVDQCRSHHGLRSYEKLAGRIGISKDTLYAITKETRWLSDQTYELVALFCKCKPENLHPRGVPRRNSD
jgi:hypothetical protein